jgi:hypothetical protein
MSDLKERSSDISVSLVIALAEENVVAIRRKEINELHRRRERMENRQQPFILLEIGIYAEGHMLVYRGLAVMHHACIYRGARIGGIWVDLIFDWTTHDWSRIN